MGAIVRALKPVAAKRIARDAGGACVGRNYYEHIIRYETSLNRITSRPTRRGGPKTATTRAIPCAGGRTRVGGIGRWGYIGRGAAALRPYRQNINANITADAAARRPPTSSPVRRAPSSVWGAMMTNTSSGVKRR